MREQRDIIFAVSAVLFLAAGAYHLYELVASLEDPRLTAFHAAFVVIDPITALLLIRRPDWFTYAFAALTVQQIYSHGMEAMTALSMSVVDYTSFFIIVFMPCLLGLLIYDAVARKPRTS